MRVDLPCKQNLNETMKTKIITLLTFVVLCRVGFSQFTFGVSPGLSMNSAYFGYKVNRVVPFAGIQYYGAKLDYTYTYQEFDFFTETIVTRETTLDSKLNLIMPNVGVKYFFKESGNLKAHVTGNFAKPIITGRLSIDGTDQPEVQELVDGISIWGGELGAGAEYFFDEYFSIGGEFGLRYIHVGFESTTETSVYNPITDEFLQSQSTYSARSAISPTFSKFSLNFYF